MNFWHRLLATVGTLALAAAVASGQSAPPPLRIESYFQLRVTENEGGGPYAGIRRFRLNLLGQPSKDASWFAQILYKDGNRSGTDHTLFAHDLWYRKRFPQGVLTVGQVRPPFALERLTSDRVLSTIDRTTVVDALIPSGGLARSFARDLGAVWEVGDERRGLVQCGAFGGNGTLQQRVYGNGPLFALRLARRWEDGMGMRRLALALARRRDRRIDFSRALPGTRALGMNRFRGDDLRIGLEAGASRGLWSLQGEYLEGRFQGVADSPRLSARGGYLMALRRLNPDWEGVLRHEVFDPNRAVRDRNDTSATTLGINGRVGPLRRDRLQVNYVWRRERVQAIHNDMVMIQYQRMLL